MKLIDLISNREFLDYCKHQVIVYLSGFGSVTSDDANAGTDVDLLVKYKKPISLFRHVEIQQAIEGILKTKVDLLTIGSLNPRLRDRILKSQKVIYDEAG